MFSAIIVTLDNLPYSNLHAEPAQHVVLKLSPETSAYEVVIPLPRFQRLEHHTTSYQETLQFAQFVQGYTRRQGRDRYLGEDEEERTAFDNSVMVRPRPDYEPLGIDSDLLLNVESGFLAGFRIFPELQTSLFWEDNVFRTDTDEQSDVFYRLRPTVDLRSNWSVHEMNMRFRGVIDRYFQETTNNSEDMEVRIFGRYDIGNLSEIRAQFDLLHQHENRGDPNAPPGILNVNQYWNYGGTIGTSYAGPDYLLELDFEVDDIDYLDNGPLDNDDRDRREYAIDARAQYRLTADLDAFIEGVYNWRRYDLETDFAGFARDSQGYNVQIGLDYDLSAALYAEFSVGYMSQNYQDDLLNDITGLGFEGEIIWNPTDLMTISGNVSRDISETILVGASGISTTSASLGMDYEILENLLFSSDLAYARQKFEGLNRDDDLISGQLGLNYFINDIAALEVSYQHARRESSALGADFENNRVMLRLTLQR